MEHNADVGEAAEMHVRHGTEHSEGVDEPASDAHRRASRRRAGSRSRDSRTLTGRTSPDSPTSPKNSVASGAAWVAVHHGGGVGIGNSIHAGAQVVADGVYEEYVNTKTTVT